MFICGSYVGSTIYIIYIHRVYYILRQRRITDKNLVKICFSYRSSVSITVLYHLITTLTIANYVGKKEKKYEFGKASSRRIKT